MIALTLPEAQLFRVLVNFFGRDHVVPQMSVMAVCGGTLPDALTKSDTTLSGTSLEVWARRNKCLFTIVDREDNPKMVIEFFSGFESAVDVVEEEHQRVLSPLLAHLGIRYVTITPSEFSELLDPESALDIVAFLKSKVDPGSDLAETPEELS